MTAHLSGPFLTDLDKRAEVKGSRDPLGIQSIWSKLGRYVVGNLTTVTTSVRDFTTLLIGLHLAERVAELEPQKSHLATFLQWEQLAGYARADHGDGAFRGIDRVHRRLSESKQVNLSGDRRDQILADQKITGVWGLYTVAARASGFVEGDIPRLTPAARELVETIYLSRMARVMPECREGRALVKLLKEPSIRIEIAGKHKQLSGAIAKALAPKLQHDECAVFRKHLVRGGPDDSTEGRQATLGGLFVQPPFVEAEFAFTPSAILELERRASKEHMDGSLAFRLARIRHCESLMAPASALFWFVLARHESSVDEIASSVRKTWGKSITTINIDAIGKIEQDLTDASRSKPSATRWIQTAVALREGDYAQAVRLLLAQNAFVMQTRGGAAPWAEERKDKIFVRFHGDFDELPQAKKLPNLWTFAYFLNALRVIAIAVHKGNA